RDGAEGLLRSPGEEFTESRVEAALRFSYNELAETDRRHFRALGAFAPDAELTGETIAEVWGCTPDQAVVGLSLLLERGLLGENLTEAEPTHGHHWRQHSLLRAYAISRLRDNAEETSFRVAHARTYLSLAADRNRQRTRAEVLREYSQLRHAFK